jgi:putative exosortase-associated protein (TIGR04073 family)
MRSVLSLLALSALVATLTSGCAGPEEKLGRGVRNTTEIVRLGELRTSMEQTAVWGSVPEAVTTGVVQGVDKSIARTGVGLYEIVTFPFPPYHPVLTKYLSPNPAYPSNYRPDMPNDPLYQTDINVGYSGGAWASWIPGSQFEVFGN